MADVLCLSYHEHIFEAKMEAEVRLLEVNCTYFVAKIKFNKSDNLDNLEA